LVNALLIAHSGLADALLRQSGLAGASLQLDKAAVEVVKATAPVKARPRDGAPVTGATGVPTESSSDVGSALVDLMSAEMSFRANVEVVRTQAEMLRSLYETFD
jgi:flagellar basal body rod protein FlgC